jgi:RNA polymerase sigma-70 factor (ECF subfamily)
VVNTAISELLSKMREGDETALGRFTELIYGELRRIARIQMRHHRLDRASEPSSLVHEAYVRILRGQPANFRDQSHFLAITAHVMRQVLVDQARARNAQKRSWGVQVNISGAGVLSREKPVDVLALNEALELLARRDKNLESMVELHFFGGLTAEEIAGVTGHTVHAVRHRLRYAKAWLRQHLESGTPTA